MKTANTSTSTIQEPETSFHNIKSAKFLFNLPRITSEIKTVMNHRGREREQQNIL